MKYIIASIGLIICMAIVIATIPFIALGELASAIAGKFMKFGDELDRRT